MQNDSFNFECKQNKFNFDFEKKKNEKKKWLKEITYQLPHWNFTTLIINKNTSTELFCDCTNKAENYSKKKKKNGIQNLTGTQSCFSTS